MFAAIRGAPDQLQADSLLKVVVTNDSPKAIVVPRSSFDIIVSNRRGEDVPSEIGMCPHLLPRRVSDFVPLRPRESYTPTFGPPPAHQGKRGRWWRSCAEYAFRDLRCTRACIRCSMSIISSRRGGGATWCAEDAEGGVSGLRCRPRDPVETDCRRGPLSDELSRSNDVRHRHFIRFC